MAAGFLGRIPLVRRSDMFFWLVDFFRPGVFLLFILKTSKADLVGFDLIRISMAKIRSRKDFENRTQPDSILLECL
jgi:hypothetical protein